MIARIFLVCCLLLREVIPLLAQSPPQVDSGSQPAVSALRTLAQTIKECPRALSSEKKWGKGPSEIERWYVGPPQNVVWDVSPSSSVRSPYMGYVEFSLPYDHWVPDEVKDKFMRSDAGSSYTLATAIGGPTKYRYEFDLGPGGLELTRMLRHGRNASGQYPAEWFDAGPEGDTCWQNAAHKLRATSDTEAPGQATNGDVPKNVDIQDSGKAFLQVCSAVDNSNAGEAKTAAIALCAGYLEGVLGGLDLAGTMLDKDGKFGGRLRDQIVYCPAQGSSPNMLQILHVVLNYIRSNPGHGPSSTSSSCRSRVETNLPMREEVKSRKPTPKKKYSSDHGHREQGVLNDLIDYCPRFLDVPNDDWVSVSKGQDPPDLVGSGRIGLELTEWLNPNQTTEAMRRLRMRGDLLRLLNEQSLPAPQNYRLVFVRPRWVKISGKEIESLRLQFHTMCQQKDLCWHSDPSVQLGWAWVIEQSFAAYPMLQKYIASVRFKADGANIAQHGFSWIRSEPEGGTQNPSDAIKALRELIIQKCRKYRNNRHLAEKHLGELVLLVHSGPMRAIVNSPYDLNFPDLLENLRYVVGQISDLSFECSLFKSIWLFQRPLGQEEHGRNRWLAQIYPTLTMPTWYSARVVNMTERASLPRQADSTSTRQAGGYVRLGRC